MATIMDTGNVSEINDLGPDEEVSNMTATDTPTEAPMAFHVQMHGHTFRDMEELIVNAAAQQLMGWHTDGNKLKKLIEERCISHVTAKADEALAKVSSEIIDQPLTPSFGDKKPVTMREFIGLTGREYLTERVDRDGKAAKSGWGSPATYTRIELLVSQYMDRHFKNEIEKATNAAIGEVRAAIKQHHEQFLAAEKKRFSEAIEKLTQA
jgi:hypothetical protein